MDIRQQGQGSDKQLHPKKSIPCAFQADDTLKPLSTNALRNQYVQILHAQPSLKGRRNVFHFGTDSH